METIAIMFISCPVLSVINDSLILVTRLDAIATSPKFRHITDYQNIHGTKLSETRSNIQDLYYRVRLRKSLVRRPE